MIIIVLSEHFLVSDLKKVKKNIKYKRTHCFMSKDDQPSIVTIIISSLRYVPNVRIFTVFFLRPPPQSS